MIARFDSRNAVPNSFNDASPFVTQDNWQRGLEGASDNFEVSMAKATRMDLHQDV